MDTPGTDTVVSLKTNSFEYHFVVSPRTGANIGYANVEHLK